MSSAVLYGSSCFTADGSRIRTSQSLWAWQLQIPDVQSLEGMTVSSSVSWLSLSLSLFFLSFFFSLLLSTNLMQWLSASCQHYPLSNHFPLTVGNWLTVTWFWCGKWTNCRQRLHSLMVFSDLALQIWWQPRKSPLWNPVCTAGFWGSILERLWWF